MHRHPSTSATTQTTPTSSTTTMSGGAPMGVQTSLAQPHLAAQPNGVIPGMKPPPFVPNSAGVPPQQRMPGGHVSSSPSSTPYHAGMVPHSMPPITSMAAPLVVMSSSMHSQTPVSLSMVQAVAQSGAPVVTSNMAQNGAFPLAAGNMQNPQSYNGGQNMFYVSMAAFYSLEAS